MRKRRWGVLPLSGLLLGLFTLVLRAVFQSRPDWTERVYSRGIFALLRGAIDHTIALLPFPVVYLLVAVLILWPIWRGIRRFGKKASPPVLPGRTRLARWIGRGIGSLGLLVFVFYIVWGFNYFRIPVETQLGLDPHPLSEEELVSEADTACRQVIDHRRRTGRPADTPIRRRDLPDDLEARLRKAQRGVLAAMGYRPPGRVRIKPLWPGSLLLRFATSGFFLGIEGYVSSRLTPTEIPFTMAHEMAHGHGFAEEGTANLLAFLTCLATEDPVVRYSGALGHWGYVAGELARIRPGTVRGMFLTLPPGTRLDLKIRRENWQRYTGWLMDVAEAVGDIYLKSQGSPEGILSYNRVVMLVAAWRKKTDRHAPPYHW